MRAPFFLIVLSLTFLQMACIAPAADGAVLSGEAVRHRFALPGVHQAIATVHEAGGASVDVSASVDVRAALHPRAQTSGLTVANFKNVTAAPFTRLTVPVTGLQAGSTPANRRTSPSPSSPRTTSGSLR